MTADYHMHNALCRHAVGTPVDYARAAVARGFTEIGCSDHNPMPAPFDDWRMLIEELPLYLEQVRAAQALFPQLTIRLGLEVDFMPGQEAWIEELAGLAEWDYFIGSVHYIAPGWDVDNPKWIGRFREGEPVVSEIWATYWAIYERAIRSGLFDFMGHPDLPKKFGFRPDGDLRRFYEPSIAALAETGTPFEINTAGLRKDVREMYPSRDFLALAHAANVPLTISSDAHAPEEIGADFDTAIQLAREVGYTHTARFARRQRTLAPL